MIYSPNNEMYTTHLRIVLETMRAHQLNGKLSKCSFSLSEAAFLGHLISAEGVALDLVKIEVVINYSRPMFLFETQEFLGLA